MIDDVPFAQNRAAAPREASTAGGGAPPTVSYSNTSDNERYRFCGGTFEYTRNRIAISGIAYDSNGAGSCNITQAAVNPDGDKVTVNGRVYDASKITC